MNPVYEKLLGCYESIKEKVDFRPEIAIVLGSGLGGFADEIEVYQTVSYEDIDGFPVSTVSGHAGRFVFGYIEHIPVIVMQGRVHYYEGYPMDDVVLPVRLMNLLGAKKLLLTNAAGGINSEFNVGDFMMLTDHVTSFVPSPLIGKNIDELGPRFCDMSEVYDPELCQLIRGVSRKMEIPIQEGTYIQMSGPAFETPAEVRLARIIGGDAVGMSTACEAVAAKHISMKICGISCITNLACGMSDKPLCHTEVQETADRVASLFKRLITGIVMEMNEL